MYKLIIAYKPHDLFSTWNYVTMEFDNMHGLEYNISHHRYNSNNPEYFKNTIFRTKDETKREQVQNIDGLHADAIIFVNEFDGLVKLRIGGKVMDLIDYCTSYETKEQKFTDLIDKYTENFYIRSSEELEEFKQVLESLFENAGDFDNIEIVDYTKDYNFPILVLVNQDQPANRWGEGDHLRFTLIDKSLGL